MNLIFYNQIKERFSVEKDTIVFISLTADSIEELKPRVFTKETYDGQYCPLLNEHLQNNKPYVVIDHLDDVPTFYLTCKEFSRQEDLSNGKITFFQADPFEAREVDMDKLKKELAQLGHLLSGNSKAS